MEIVDKGNMEEVPCDHRGCDFVGTKLGNHWYYHPSHRPDIEHFEDVITGILMGDGSIKQNNNPYLVIGGFTTPEYLQYLDQKFNVMGTGVRLDRTAEESATVNSNNELSLTVNHNEYSDCYRWRTRCHPELSKFSDWYDSGEKVWPDDLRLKKETLRHWFVCDGSWDNNGYHNRIRIGMSSEYDNIKKVEGYFEDMGLPTPSNYNKQESPGEYDDSVEAEFTVNDSKELWEYMDHSLPGFEYKWPDEYK